MSQTPKPILRDLTPGDGDALRARFDRHVDRSGGPDACWPWSDGSVNNGYGVIWTTTKAATRRLVKAHRLAYEFAHDGECPDSVDHTCHDLDCESESTWCPHRLCCNPAHLAATTGPGNARRAQKGRAQPSCRNDHPMTPENTYEQESGSRRCRRCAADAAFVRREQAARERRRPANHYRPRGMSLPELVNWALDGEQGDGCWTWRDGRVRPDGYVEVFWEGKLRGAHRLVHQVLVGPIPDRHVIDHTCHDPSVCPGGLLCPHRACVNPGHLAAVPSAVNTSVARSARRRPDACGRGHAFDEVNTYTDKRGSRHCRTCQRDRARATDQKEQAVRRTSARR